MIFIIVCFCCETVLLCSPGWPETPGLKWSSCHSLPTTWDFRRALSCLALIFWFLSSLDTTFFFQILVLRNTLLLIRYYQRYFPHLIHNLVNSKNIPFVLWQTAGCLPNYNLLLTIQIPRSAQLYNSVFPNFLCTELWSSKFSSMEYKQSDIYYLHICNLIEHARLV